MGDWAEMYDQYFDKMDDSDHESVCIDIVRVVRTTEKGILIEIDKGFTSWFPKSVCAIEGDTLVYPDWFPPTWEKPDDCSGDFDEC